MKNSNNINRKIIKVLREINIIEGQKILDCCCGEGNYTLPAAEIVGKNGLVYALDMNEEKLNALKKKSDLENIENIKIIEKRFESNIPLPDRSIDVVLLYDVFWYFSLDDRRLPNLLDEVHRILKDGSVVSIFPEHIDVERLKEKIKKARFKLENECYKKIIHENDYIKGHILNFRKI